MNIAHANDQPTITDVAFADTQQIHPIGRTHAPEPIIRQSPTDRIVVWGLVVAIGLAAGALGVGILTLTSAPDAVAGPQGATGPQGAAGAQGIQGAPGPQGPQGSSGPAGPAGPRGATGLTGKQGPVGQTGSRGPAGATGLSGTAVSSTAVTGTPVLSTVDPSIGTTVTALASCPPGDILLGGGAQVSAPGSSGKNVVLRSSYPTGNGGWRAIGSVVGPLGTGDQMTVRPFAVCGKASTS